jgi:hypothetical protein
MVFSDRGESSGLQEPEVLARLGVRFALPRRTAPGTAEERRIDLPAARLGRPRAHLLERRMRWTLARIADQADTLGAKLEHPSIRRMGCGGHYKKYRAHHFIADAGA